MGDFEIIYETKGKAKEYAPLSVELYTGCSHGCAYCFVPKVLNVSPKEFHSKARPVENVISKLEKDAKLLKKNKDDREILLCFHSDPYQPFYDEELNRKAIETLIENDLRFTILTKSGLLGTYHFDLLRGYEKFSFGTTLIFTNQDDADKWEPNAAEIDFRIEAIKKARNKKIKTWVSLEPVIDPKQALELIQKYHSLVDHWKIGIINYHPEIEAKVDWIRFRREAKTLLNSLGADYYLKKSLTDLSGTESQKKDLKMNKKINIHTAGGKMTKLKSARTGADVKIIPGSDSLLLIAPHGVSVPGKKMDDKNTDKLTAKITNRIKCSAIINNLIKRDELNFNVISQAEKHLQFINGIKNVVEKDGDTLVVWVHGADDISVNGEAMDKDSAFEGKPENLHALIGYGQGPNPMVPPKRRKGKDEKSQHTAAQKTVEKFRDLLTENGMTTIVTRDNAPKFRGRHPDNMNQWFIKQGYKLSKVQSLQLEIREKGFRSIDKLDKTAQIIATALSGIVPLPVKVETKADDLKASEAFEYLKEIFKRHFHEAMLEAGRYLIKTFYKKNPEIAFAKNKTKEQPQSLKKLIEKIQQTSNNPSENVPSTSWLYNAVNLAAHEMICKQEGFQTFGILGHSHKLQLLHVPKLKKIDKDKFNEAIRPAFQEKERLATVAIEKKLSVRDFKAYIKAQHPDDSGTIDLTKLPPLDELRQRESKELSRLRNLAKRKIDECQKKIDEYQKMRGSYNEAFHTLNDVLTEKEAAQTGEMLLPKTVKVITDDGLEKEAIVPIIISESRVPV